jgi:6-phosphogluconolactonase
VAQVVVADDLALAGARWIADRAPRSIALSGGGTPRPIYERLAGSGLPWADIHFYFGDERCVPPDHPDSNYRMAKAALFDRAPIPPENVHRMEAERPDREAAARAYEAILPPALDLILLGMGEDLHTASLFPGGAWLRATGRRVIHVTGAPKPPPERLSITPEVIAAARDLLVVASGAGKADQVARALDGPARPDLYPIHLARRATWLLDAGAASQLKLEEKS